MRRKCNSYTRRSDTRDELPNRPPLRLDNTADLGDAADVNYPGGKNGSGVYQRLINLMPPHSVYIEPFLGGGALMRLKRPAAFNIGVDLDAELIARWRARNKGGRILSPEMAVSAEAGGIARNGVEDLEELLGRNGDATRCEFRHGNGIEFLRFYKFTGAELVYCDPPYLLSSRTSCDGDYYRREMTDVQHRELLRVLRTLRCRVMLSGYSSHLYDLHLQGWNSIRYQAPTRRGMREEWLWFNYDRPVELHDYRYLGATYRERENLRKQQRRWKAKLERMPLQQRQALLAAIADTATFSDGAQRSPI